MFGTFDTHDNCDTEVALSYDVNEDEIIELFTIDSLELTNGCYEVLRKVTLTDDCGNTTVIDQIITVIDNTPPVYQGPGQISIPALVPGGRSLRSRRGLGIQPRRRKPLRIHLRRRFSRRVEQLPNRLY